jgi:hypothetical protein
MAIVGILVTLLGWIIAVMSLTLTQSAGARLGIVLIGIAVSLFGIMGIVNTAYLKNVNWRKE